MLNPTLQSYQTRNQRVLKGLLANADVPERLLSAMRYSTLAGGKRFRALLVYAAGLAVGAPLKRLDAVAAALECIHSYSLIHDDLPSMDNDELRRGQATSHIKYDEATAILAGDALQALAFEVLSSETSQLSDQQVRSITYQIAIHSGQTGMVGGQMLDIIATQQNLDRAQLENIHRRKTGALINAAVVCGALCSDTVSDKKLTCLQDYAKNIGLAFQVMDDVLDVESSTEILGKLSRADQALGKPTFVSLMGLPASKTLAQNLYQQAIVCVASIGDNSDHLIDLAALAVNRTH